MDEVEAANWTRHFDTLLWSVTSIFAAAIGALIAYSYANFDIAISILQFQLQVYFLQFYLYILVRVSEKLEGELVNI